MTAVELEEKKDRRLDDSPCCQETPAGDPAAIRWSEPCNAPYCDGCDRWIEEPHVEAVYTGPTWERNPETGKFRAPTLTLGPAIVAWVKTYVNSPDGNGEWKFTGEQLRLLYWIYALRPDGRWLYREINIQRLKGWGKDPFAALLCLIELLGPCRPELDDDGNLVLDERGNPVGRQETAAWISIAAVSKKQTKNTMLVFGAIVSKKMKADYGVVVGKEQVVANVDGTVHQIEAVTSSPETMEGNRPTAVVGNEPHHWKENNRGHDMRSVIDRNLKREWSRAIWITNAYNPSEESVGQLNREGWEDAQGEDAKYVDTGILYDSLEAPENARMVPREIPHVLEAVRGDAFWVDIEGITNRILDPRNSVIESRRFYYNQIRADEEAFVDKQDVDATIHKQVAAWRADPEIEVGEDGGIRLGWAPVAKHDEIVVFFDGGKTDDHTAISGCRLSDGYTFALGRWARPRDLPASVPWSAPRGDVDRRMLEIWERFTVVALWGDPSHAKDDEEDTPYWDDLLNTWHRRWKDKLKFWAVKTGEGQHSVIWDMTSPARAAQFVMGVGAFRRDMEERAFEHDGHPAWIRYMLNAKLYMTKYGESIWKGARGSKRKIDGAVTHVGARMMRDFVLNRAEEEKPTGGDVWW